MNTNAPVPELNHQAWQAVTANPREALQMALEALETLDACAVAASGEDDLARARALRTIGAARLELGEMDGVAEPLVRAWGLAGDTAGRELEALQISRLLARYRYLRQEYEAALNHIHDALALSPRCSDAKEAARALNDAGSIYAQIGHYQQGLDYLIASHKLLDEKGIAPLPGTLNNIGQIYMVQEKPAEALDYFERAYAAMGSEDSARVRVTTLGNCGRALSALGMAEQALQRHEQAVAIARAEDLFTYLPAALSKYAVALSETGKVEEAFDAFDEARLVEEEHGSPFRDERLLALGWVLLEHDEPGRAEACFREAADLALGQGNESAAVGGYEGLSEALSRTGQWREALEAHKVFHELSAREQKAALSAQTQALLLHQEIERSQREQELLRSMNSELSSAYEQLQLLHTELEQKSSELERLSVEDPLTKVFNRRHLEKRLVDETTGEGEDGAYSLIMCDIDDFKSINDRYGHTVGDQILVQFAGILRSSTRRSDVIARVGGEEFILLLPDTGLGDAVKVAEKIRRAAEAFPWAQKHPGLQVTISAGVSEASGGRGSSEALSEADRRLHIAKREGKNRVCADPHPILHGQFIPSSRL